MSAIGTTSSVFVLAATVRYRCIAGLRSALYPTLKFECQDRWKLAGSSGLTPDIRAFQQQFSNPRYSTTAGQSRG